MAQNEQLPNVILILTDQHRADFLGCYGHPRVRTPNIDALSHRGTRFERCYVASPVCMPNRASIMTGRMPSAHRARMNGIPLSLRENTFVDLLRLRGYRTALIGKSHLQNMIDVPPFIASLRKESRGWRPPETANEAVRRVPDDDYGQELPSRWKNAEPYRVKTPFYGFEEAILCPGHGDQVGGHYFQWLRTVSPDPDRLKGPANALPHESVCPDAWRTAVPEEWYPTRYIENETVAYLKRHAATGGSPFFLAMSFPDPHHPFTPPGRYWDMYDPSDQVLPASFHHEDEGLPQVRWARSERERSDGKDRYSAFAASEREAREAIALTAGLVTMIDDAVGRVVRTLRETGLAENTVIVFSSDHGDYLGDHGLLLKGPLHLQSLIRVPLIWFDPKSPVAGRASSVLASSIDISATILDRVQIDPYNGMQGKSLLPVIEASMTRHRESVLIEEDAQKAHFGFKEAPRIRSLVTQRYRLSLYGRTGHGELFDLENDPQELHNRFASRDYAATRAELMEELAFAEMEAADTSPMPVYLA